MKYSNISCFDDLLRDAWWPAKVFFYDLIREPIRQATGFDIGASPRINGKHNLSEAFNKDEFINLCLSKGLGWESCYFQIPREAERYLLTHIPPGTLILSYEMPPWLSSCLDSSGIPYVDIRISPLRFARDLYIALRSNDTDLSSKIEKISVLQEEIKLEAALVSASVRHLLRYEPQINKLNNSLIYIGQTSDDASLVSSSGEFLRINQFVEEIRSNAAGKRLLYKPHPSAGKFANSEMRILSSLVGRNVENCSVDIYRILGSEEDVNLIGISSGALQEAPWFGKNSLMLYRPTCPLAGIDNHERYQYWQIHLDDIIAPQFWHSLLAPKSSPPRLERLPSIQANHLRNLHNVWWGYSTYLTKGKHFWIEAFENSGGEEIRSSLDDLKKGLVGYVLKGLIKNIIYFQRTFMGKLRIKTRLGIF